MSRTRLITIGSCTARDALSTAFSKKTDNFDLDDFYSGSIFSGVVPPGEIARLMLKWKQSHPSSLSTLFQQQYDRIVKHPNLNILVDTITPADVVVLDWGYELVKQYISDTEQFDVTLDFQTDARRIFPSQICDQILNGTVKFDMLDHSTIMARHHRLVEFFKLLKSKTPFIVCLGNVSTDLEWCYSTNSIVKNLSSFETRLPFFTVDDKYAETNLNSSYYFEIVTRFYSHVQRIAENEGIDWVNIDQSKCIRDPRHHFGPSPSHLHFLSRVLIKEKLINTINSMLSRKKAQVIIPAPLTLRKPKCKLIKKI